ncbi:MAG: hypothetical protein ACTSP4_15575 [Candidatus Hodarchaeales archaeon]
MKKKNKEPENEVWPPIMKRIDSDDLQCKFVDIKDLFSGRKDEEQGCFMNEEELKERAEKWKIRTERENEHLLYIPGYVPTYHIMIN